MPHGGASLLVYIFIRSKISLNWIQAVRLIPLKDIWPEPVIASKNYISKNYGWIWNINLSFLPEELEVPLLRPSTWLVWLVGYAQLIRFDWLVFAWHLINPFCCRASIEVLIEPKSFRQASSIVLSLVVTSLTIDKIDWFIYLHYRMWPLTVYFLITTRLMRGDEQPL